ncbi:hypothetical protein [Streptomyces cyaneofuscatus]|uniref:hypothetical protein n=1 Tax=Streptomyces cyaneofuscatus TaxID=66883 RepID=UPI003803825D
MAAAVTLQPRHTVDATHRVVQEEELLRLAASEADRGRELLTDAVNRGDDETIRSEGPHWSGHIAVFILQLADRVEEATTRDGAPRRTADIQEET